jgi:transposase
LKNSRLPFPALFQHFPGFWAGRWQEKTSGIHHHQIKFVEWFDNPPTTADFISFHDKAFRYFKGMPKEIVYDQDRLLKMLF